MLFGDITLQLYIMQEAVMEEIHGVLIQAFMEQLLPLLLQNITPSISCDGNNITVVYDDDDASDLIAAISTDSGQTWSWKVVVDGDGYKASAALYSMPGNYYTPVVERRGQRIYIVYDWEYATIGQTPYFDYCQVYQFN